MNLTIQHSKPTDLGLSDSRCPFLIIFSNNTVQVSVNVNNILNIIVMIIVMCLTTENTKLIILLIFTNETLDIVIFPLDTGYMEMYSGLDTNTCPFTTGK